MRTLSLPARVFWTLATACLASACTYDMWHWEMCELDKDLCTIGAEGWTTVAGCAQTDPLQVQLGTGEDHSFVELPVATPPTIFVPAEKYDWTVGDRVYLGARIANPAAGHKRFLLQFRVCSTGGYGYNSGDYGKGQVPIPGTPTCLRPPSGYAIQAGESMQLAADGSVARGGVPVGVAEKVLWAAVYAQDECGREGVDIRVY